ncbi:MAG: tRNA-dihydrouridine synthase [Succinivibrionaceae bacterium]|nr:tRNA-dihydrouridine synthase [Succinivibrionaceae bacterium]
MLQLVLAPMDGVLDAPLRQVLTAINPFDFCESEFVRITDKTVSSQTLLKKVPELNTGGRTSSGAPVYVQFLGSDPKAIAASAALAVSMGAPGIDLNFGCPAKQVNRSNGGAALLKDPDLMRRICADVRNAVPDQVPVHAKMRLGFDSCDRYLELAEALYSSGISMLCVHGRTKVDEYLPGTVRWDLIGRIREVCPVPVIANGDVFDRPSAQKCLEITGCQALMLGRGALCLPNLAAVIRNDDEPYDYLKMTRVVHSFVESFERFNPEGNLFARFKQFLSYLREHYSPLKEREVFKRVCRAADVMEALEILDASARDSGCA